MGVLRRALSETMDRRGWTVPPELIPPWASGFAGGAAVDRRSVSGLSAAWACIRLLNSTVSRMPIDALTSSGGHPTAARRPRWLDRPVLRNPNVDSVQHFAQVMSSALYEGNFFTLTPRDEDGFVTEVFVADPREVEITGTMAAPGYKVTIDRTRRYEFGPDDVIHRPLLTLPGEQRGLAPIEACRQVFGAGLSAQEFGLRFFSQAATPSGVIEVPIGSQVSIDELKAGWVQKHTGLANAHTPGVLTGGAAWKPLSFTNEQSQFIEARQFSLGESARIWGVPPHMIGDTERSTSWGTGIEVQGIGFVTYSLNDYLVLIESAYRRAMPDPNEFIRFNRNALLRGDAKSRSALYRTLWEIGVFNADTILAYEDLAPQPDGLGEKYYVPANYIEAGTQPSDDTLGRALVAGLLGQSRQEATDDD